MRPHDAGSSSRDPAAQERVRALAQRFGVNPIIQEWRKRTTTADAAIRPKQPRSTVLTPEQEAVPAAFRKHTPLPLDA